MSRIGKKVIVLPTNVTVHFEGSKVTCKGPKGELSHEFNPAMKFELDGQHLSVVRPDDSKEMKELHGIIWFMAFQKDLVKNFSLMVLVIVLQ